MTFVRENLPFVATYEQVLDALGDRTRRQIVQVLRGGPAAVGELAERIPVSRPAISQHLRVLKDAGLVEVRADAQRRLYRIRPEPLAEIDHWLAPYRELWNTSLDRLERHLDSRRNA